MTPKSQEKMGQESKKVILAVVEARLDKGEFMKHFKVHPVGSKKNGKQPRIIILITHIFKRKVF